MTEVTFQNISYKLHFHAPDFLENFTAHGNWKLWILCDSGSVCYDLWITSLL